MQITRLAMPEVLLTEPKVFGDARGFFYKSFSQRTLDEATGTPTAFVQDDHSRSRKGVLRGLYYRLQQLQGKLLGAARGAAFHPAVDIRKDSLTFGRGAQLSENSPPQLWGPSGLTHGFVVLSEIADFLCKTIDYYASALERCIRWDEPQLAIELSKLDVPVQLSAKNKADRWLAEADWTN